MLDMETVRGWGLNDEQVEALAKDWAEREEAAEQMRQKNVQLEAETAEVRNAFAEYCGQVEEKNKRALVREALLAGGVNPAAAELLALQADLAKVCEKDGALEDADGLLAEMRKKWGDLFTVEENEPLEGPCPPKAEDTLLTRETVAGMSVEEINRNWHAVKAALGVG